MPRTVKLSKPLQTHKGLVEELVLRDITARDMVEMRVAPMTTSMTRNGRGDNTVIKQEYEIQYDRMMTLAGRLAEGADEAILKDLPARDFNKIVDAVAELWRDAEGE